MPPIIDPSKCIGCGTCADICNSDIFVFNKEVHAVPQVKFPEECWHCESCVLDCPAEAIRLRIPLAYTFLNINASMLHNTKENNNVAR